MERKQEILLSVDGAINICGGLVLFIWLLVDPFDLPMRGYLLLWAIALLVLVVGVIEIAAKSWQY